MNELLCMEHARDDGDLLADVIYPLLVAQARVVVGGEREKINAVGNGCCDHGAAPEQAVTIFHAVGNDRRGRDAPCIKR